MDTIADRARKHPDYAKMIALLEREDSLREELDRLEIEIEELNHTLAGGMALSDRGIAKAHALHERVKRRHAESLSGDQP